MDKFIQKKALFFIVSFILFDVLLLHCNPM